MLKTTAAGRIGRDAETRKTQAGDSVTSFTMAVDVRNGRDKETVWLRCSIWGKRGESLAQYLLKGASVTVTGSLSFSEYEGKQQVNVSVDDVALQGGQSGERGGGNGGPPTHRNQDGFGTSGRGQVDDDLDDSVPFVTCNLAWERRVS